MKKFFFVLVPFALLAQFLPGGLFPDNSAQAQEPTQSSKISLLTPQGQVRGTANVSKISGLLALQVEGKRQRLQAELQQVKPGGKVATPQTSNQTSLFPVLQSESVRTEDLEKQQIFIHFAQKPTPSQIAELVADNITPYPDSWIPPVGDHHTGFILADIPVNKLETLAGKGYVVSLETAERQYEPQNDLAAQAINAPAVWASGNGTGVRIAVLDSGLDLTHPDIPAPVVKKDYSNYNGDPLSLDDTIANTVTGHGTHVTGSVVGSGNLSGGIYRGMASGASLIFLKIGNDSNAGASTAAIVGAIRAATDTYHADIITMSYGGWGDDYHDGSSEEAQAVDYAVSQGVTVLMAAGNDAARDWHYSGTVGPGGITGFIQVNTNVSGNTGNYRTGFAYNLVWYDGTGIHNDLALEYYDSGFNLLASTNGTQSESPRGTESEYSFYNSCLPVGTYSVYLKVHNYSLSSQPFHLYYNSIYNGTSAGTVKFNSPDPNYTIGSPADADGAIAVGAYTTRKYWTNYKGSTYSMSSSETVDTISTFSSRGPRVDLGAGKPNIVAPGSAIISARDTNVLPWSPSNDPAIIDNDGLNLGPSNTGPADYFAMQGTSMACPIAAGVAALILQKNPGWTPDQIKNALETTATDKGTPGWDSTYGYGLINAQAAVSAEPLGVTTGNATNITLHSANVSGNLTSLGLATTANVSFEYGTTTSYGSNTTVQVMTDEDVFSGILPGLSSNTTYHYRAKADGGANGVASGNDMTFATLTTPVVVTGSATNITLNSANISGNLTSLGTATTANVSFEYGTNTSYGSNTTIQVVVTRGVFSAVLPVLSSNTTYHYRANAEGGVNGIGYGTDMTFATLTMPTVTTGNATNISPYSATLSGNITSLGSAASANASFLWGTPSGNYTSETANITTSLPGAFSANITGLSANTTYYFIAKAYGHGTVNGTEQNFKTLLPVPPTVITNNAANIGLYTATLSGNITAFGTASSANTSFLWGTPSGNYTSETANITMSLPGAFSANLTGLSANTTYYFIARVYGHGTVNGAEQNFKTLLPVPPSVITNNAINIGPYTATLSGNITAFGTASSANASFLWGTPSGNYTSETTNITMSLPGAFSANLTGLSANTTYYFIAKAYGHGTANGTEQNFSTPLPVPPQVATGNASGITYNSARLNGNVDLIGTASSVNVTFQWGTISGNLTNETTVQAQSGNGSFSFDLGNLSASTPYHFRAKASGHGTVTGNETSFTTLSAPPPPPSGGGGGGGGGGAAVSLSGFAGAQPNINLNGYTTADSQLVTTNGKLTLNIAKFTRILDSFGRPLYEFTAAIPSQLPAVSGGGSIVLAQDLGPNGVTFDPPVLLTFNYEDSSLPSGAAESGLYIAWWNGSEWERIETTLDTGANTASANIKHFSIFALITPVGISTPASFPTSIPSAPVPAQTTTTSTPAIPTQPVSEPTPITTKAVSTPVEQSVIQSTSPAPESNNQNSLYWWILASVVIVIAGGSSVFFLRRLKTIKVTHEGGETESKKE